MAEAGEGSVPATNVIRQIAETREQNLLIHDMQDPERFPGVIAFLAEHNIFTTCEPRDPGTFTEFRKEIAIRRQLGKLATNATEALVGANNPVLNNAIQNNRIGSVLVELFADTDVRSISGTYFADERRDKKDHIVGGTVTASLTTFTVSNVENQTLLSDVFQAWGRTNAKLPHIVKTGTITRQKKVAAENEQPEEAVDKHTVSVTNLDEYTIRMMEHALSSIVAKEDLEQTRTQLPLDRRPLSVWKARGETFHPAVEARIQAVNNQYSQMLGTVSTSSRGPVRKLITKEMRDKPEVLGSSSAAAFEVLRKGINIVNREWRKTGRLNQDQNPRRADRLLIEKGVDIRRDKGKPGESGPPLTRALTLAEKMKEEGREYVEYKKKHPLVTAVKSVAKVAGMGIEAAVEFAADKLPQVRNSQTVQDWRAWRSQKRSAIEAGKKLDDLLNKAT